MKSENKPYHHGNLAESLLEAVDELATKFGLEAVTLRACAKIVGVSPSSAFRHYADKRALLTAFATKALDQLSELMEFAQDQGWLQCIFCSRTGLYRICNRQTCFFSSDVERRNHLYQ